MQNKLSLEKTTISERILCGLWSGVFGFIAGLMCVLVFGGFAFEWSLLKWLGLFALLMALLGCIKDQYVSSILGAILDAISGRR